MIALPVQLLVRSGCLSLKFHPYQLPRISYHAVSGL